MGKGGTRFVGEAVGVRSGRAKAGLSGKQMRKDMEHFQKTGRPLYLYRLLLVRLDVKPSSILLRVKQSCAKGF